LPRHVEHEHYPLSRVELILSLTQLFLQSLLGLFVLILSIFHLLLCALKLPFQLQTLLIQLVIMSTYHSTSTDKAKHTCTERLQQYTIYPLFKVYVPLDTKQDILETFFPANLLVCTEETKPGTIKANIHPEHKYTTQNKYKKLKPGLVTSYDLWPGYEGGPILIAPRAHTGQFISSLQTITTLKNNSSATAAMANCGIEKANYFQSPTLSDVLLS